MKANNMLLNNEWDNNEIKDEIKRYPEKNENTATPNLLDIAKSVVRGKFIVIHTFLEKQEKSQPV